MRFSDTNVFLAVLVIFSFVNNFLNFPLVLFSQEAQGRPQVAAKAAPRRLLKPSWGALGASWGRSGDCDNPGGLDTQPEGRHTFLRLFSDHVLFLKLF